MWAAVIGSLFGLPVPILVREGEFTWNSFFGLSFWTACIHRWSMLQIYNRLMARVLRCYCPLFDCDSRWFAHCHHFRSRFRSPIYDQDSLDLGLSFEQPFSMTAALALVFSADQNDPRLIKTIFAPSSAQHPHKITCTSFRPSKQLQALCIGLVRYAAYAGVDPDIDSSAAVTEVALAPMA